MVTTVDIYLRWKIVVFFVEVVKRTVSMRLHFLQHVWFEDLGNIKVWADKREITISRTAFFSKEQLPSINDFDWLVIMGGSMGVYDEAQYHCWPARRSLLKKR